MDMINRDGENGKCGQELPGGKYPEVPRVAVGAVVFHNDRILLVKRSNPPSEDLWAIPGGRVMLGESLQAAAKREILEETGILISPGEPVYTFDYIERDDGGNVRFHYVITDLHAEYAGGAIHAGDDAEEARWVSRGEIGQLRVTPKTLALLENLYNFSATGNIAAGEEEKHG
jgi:ADP-ribose pyrophosphatase